jgi:four helix bundle protein
MHNFKEILGWKKAMEMAEEVYKVTKNFPSEERYGLTSQIRRCAVSVSSNIAEGAGRKSHKEFIQFLRISLGSSFELETQLILAKNIGFLNQDEFDRVIEILKETQRLMIGFEKSLKSKV